MQQNIQLGSHPTMALLRAAAAACVDKWRRRVSRRALRRLVAVHTKQEIAGLDDRTLWDLGLTRSEIGSMASEITGGAAATRRRVA